MGKFSRTVRGTRGEVSDPAKCAFGRFPKFFQVLHRAHFRGWAWCGAQVSWDSRLAAGSLGEGTGSAGVSPSPRAGVRDVLDGPHRRAPSLSPHLGAQSPPPPAGGAQPYLSLAPRGRLPPLRGWWRRTAPGGAWAADLGKPLWNPGVERCRLPCPATPHYHGFSAWIAPPRARSKHQGASFMPGPLPIPEQNAFPSPQIPRLPTLPLAS